MNFFSNIKSDFDEVVSFEINSNNLIKTSLINSLRRILISEIPIYSISESKTNFTKNSSVLDNEYISHRLSLVPIKNDLKYNYEDFRITLNKKNEDINMISVYLSDFEVKNGEDIIKNNDFFKYPNIPILKLKNDQEIILSCELIKGIGKKYAGFSPVCPATYYMKYDKDLDDEDKERKYEKDKLGYPKSYIFSIESCGNYTSKKLFVIAIEKLIEKLDIIKKDILNEKNEKVIFKPSNIKLKAYDLFFKNENDTIGNLLTQYIMEEENIQYCGYNIEHPLKDELVIRIAYQNNTKEEIANLVNNNIDKIKNLLYKIKNEWETKIKV